MPTKAIYAAIQTSEKYAAVEVGAEFAPLVLMEGGFRFPPDFQWAVLEKEGKVRLSDAVRAEIAVALEQLFRDARVEARAPAAEGLRAEFERVARKLSGLRDALRGLSAHAATALERFLGGPGHIVEMTTRARNGLVLQERWDDGEGELLNIERGHERLRRALAAGLDRDGGLPVGQQNDHFRIMVPMVYRLGEIYHDAGGKVSEVASPPGPFARFVAGLNDALPDAVRHKSREDGIFKAVSYAVVEIRRSLDQEVRDARKERRPPRASSWAGYMGKPTQTGRRKSFGPGT